MGSAVTQLLVFTHRWIGILLGLLFAMWFATGMVMMYVPYPVLPDTDRLAALEVIDHSRLKIAPVAALSRCTDAPTALRVITVMGRPAYVCHFENNQTQVVYGDTGAEAAMLTVGDLKGILRRIADRPSTTIRGPIDYDQWIVAQKYDPFRPLFRIELDDESGTHLYVSARTGEFLQRTTRSQRVWNYLGAVLHWIYPTLLRKDHGLWDTTVWWISLVALIGTLLGVYLGIDRSARVRRSGRRSLSAFRVPWMRWHHLLGLFAGVLVLSWIFSGWLSMDHGRLFSVPSATPDQQKRMAGSDFSAIAAGVELDALTGRSGASEIEIHAFDGGSVLVALAKDGRKEAPLLNTSSIRRALASAWPGQKVVSLEVVGAGDAYTDLREGRLPDGTLRAVLDDDALTWVHIDAHSGQILSVMDRSRRIYRWLFNGLHSLDFPGLADRRPLWDIVMFLGLLAGLSVSLTGVVIGVRRLFSTVSR